MIIHGLNFILNLHYLNESLFKIKNEKIIIYTIIDIILHYYSI